MGCTSFVEDATMTAPMTAVEAVTVVTLVTAVRVVVAVAVEEAACGRVPRGLHGVVLVTAGSLEAVVVMAAIVVAVPVARVALEARDAATGAGMARWRVGARVLVEVMVTAQAARAVTTALSSSCRGAGMC